MRFGAALVERILSSCVGKLYVIGVVLLSEVEPFEVGVASLLEAGLTPDSEVGV